MKLLTHTQECAVCPEMVVIDGKEHKTKDGIVCDDCLDSQYSECTECGEYALSHDGNLDNYHNFYCEDCSSEYLKFCDDCEKFFHIDNEVYSINGGSKIVCENCFATDYFNCEGCDGSFSNKNAFDIQGNSYCADCSAELTSFCDYCEESYLTDNVTYHEETDRHLCTSCYVIVEGKNRHIVSSTFEKTLGIKTRYGVELECYRKTSDCEADTAGFKIGEDGSINTPDNNDEEYSAEEHRSNVLQGDAGIDLITKKCKALQENGYEVNTSTGFHCHIDATTLSQKELLNVLSFARVFDEVLFSLQPKSRRKNHYCQKINVSQAVIKRIKNKDITFSHEFEGMDRYKGFNIQAYWKHGTIEFRYHAGTINEEKIINWVLLCLSIVEKGKGKTWTMLKKGIQPTKANLIRLLKICALPDNVKEYFIKRYEKFQAFNLIIPPKKETMITSRPCSSLASNRVENIRTLQDAWDILGLANYRGENTLSNEQREILLAGFNLMRAYGANIYHIENSLINEENSTHMLALIHRLRIEQEEEERETV